jgi:hypothetical protein
VTWNPYPPLPAGPLRDLLGITRALYRAGMTEEPRDAARLAALEEIGRTLKAALRASRAPPGTITHGEARAAAERATRALRELVSESTLLGPVIAAIARLISRSGSMVSSTPARVRNGHEGEE